MEATRTCLLYMHVSKFVFSGYFQTDGGPPPPPLTEAEEMALSQNNG